MTRKTLFLLWTLLTAGVIHRASAQCTSNAGTITNPGNYNICSENASLIVLNQGSVLDSNDIKRYIIHDGTPTQVGNVLFSTSGLSVAFNAATMSAGVTYQVAVVVGNANGNLVDLSDPCLSVAGGATITFTAVPTVQINVPGPLSCGNNLVLTANVSPPNPNYTYEWFGFGLSSGGLTFAVNQPGFVYLFITDPVSGCFAGDTVQIVADNTIPTVQIQVSNQNCGATPTYTAVTNNPANTYLWSTNETTAAIQPTTQGTYCVTVSSPAGCAASACRVFIPSTPLEIEILSAGNGNICTDSLGLFVQISGGVQPFNFLWNNGSTWNWQQPQQPGLYSITVTDGNGCTAVDSYFVESDLDDCGTIEGIIFADYNNDCTLNGSDIGLQGFTIRVEGAGGLEFFTWSDANGAFDMALPQGTYTVSVALNNSPWSPCQASYNVTVPAGGTGTLSIPLQASEFCPQLEVDLGNAFLRRCNANNFYYVSYQNLGTTTAEDAYVDILLDDFLSINFSTIPYTSLGNNLYRFPIGDVAVNASGSFHFKVTVSCDAVLGQTHCVEATIYPNEPCPTASAAWSGASVRLSAECSGGEIRFSAKNVGIGGMTVPLEYVIIEDAVMLKMQPVNSDPLGPGEERPLFSNPANGATWRIESNQEPFHPGFSMPSLTVEGCATGQVFTTGLVNQLEQNDADVWTDIECRENIGSYDPNDKQGFPVGYGDKHYIRPGVDIEYMIRFQNTGTDTAFLVIIRDTLSPWLDPGSVRPGASSHPYKFDYYGDGYLKFVFDPIALPDSNVNVAGSQGFVSFRVSQRAEVPLETDIFNSAAIYFDANEPVITNTTRHRVGENFITVSTWNPVQSGLDLLIQPNPAFDYALLRLQGIAPGTDWQIELVDVLGRVALRQNVQDAQFRLERGQLAAGTYWVRVASGGRLLGTGKMVLR